MKDRRKASTMPLWDFVMARRNEILTELDQLDKVIALFTYPKGKDRDRVALQLRACRDSSDTFAQGVVNGIINEAEASHPHPHPHPGDHP